MELIYALLIFFGMMTPAEYSSQSNTAFNPEAMVQTVQSNQAIFQEIGNSTDIAERIRMIDRTDD